MPRRILSDPSNADFVVMTFLLCGKPRDNVAVAVSHRLCPDGKDRDHGLGHGPVKGYFPTFLATHNSPATATD